MTLGSVYHRLWKWHDRQDRTSRQFLHSIWVSWNIIIYLLIYNLTFFSWSGQYTAASVKWTVPTKANVKVCLFLDGNCSMMTFNKTGNILKHEKLGYTAIDGGDLLKLLRSFILTFILFSCYLWYGSAPHCDRKRCDKDELEISRDNIVWICKEEIFYRWKINVQNFFCNFVYKVKKKPFKCDLCLYDISL